MRRCFSQENDNGGFKIRAPGNLSSFLKPKQESAQESASEYEQSLGRPMTPKEKFEREQIEKERKEIEEEDHQEDVSF